MSGDIEKNPGPEDIEIKRSTRIRRNSELKNLEETRKSEQQEVKKLRKRVRFEVI